jgi:membrane protein
LIDFASSLAGREVIHISWVGAIHRTTPGLSAARTVSANIRVALALLRESGLAWLEDKAPGMSAALTFYAILSLIPVLIVATAVAGLGFWHKLAETEALRQIQALLGETSAKALQAAILNANKPALNSITGMIGIGAILVGASGAFIELQDALNKIWRVEPKSGSILLDAIKQRILSFGLVLGTGILLLLSLISSATLGVAQRFMGQVVSWPVFLESVDFLLSFAVITLLLAMIYKVLPDTPIAWRDVWLGAAIASLVFTISKVLILLYLGGSAVASAYGAVASPLVILAWIYYSAQIVIFGAEVTHIYANKHGSRVESPLVQRLPVERSLYPISSPHPR